MFPYATEALTVAIVVSALALWEKWDTAKKSRTIRKKKKDG